MTNEIKRPYIIYVGGLIKGSWTWNDAEIHQIKRPYKIYVYNGSLIMWNERQLNWTPTKPCNSTIKCPYIIYVYNGGLMWNERRIKCPKRTPKPNERQNLMNAKTNAIIISIGI